MELEQKEKLLENFKKVYFLLPVPDTFMLNIQVKLMKKRTIVLGSRWWEKNLS